MAYMRRTGVNFSQREFLDLLKSMGVIGLAFAIMRVGIKGIAGLEFVIILAISLVTVGLGFLLHELAHKIVAQKYGCWAEYRGDDKMLLFTLLLSAFGFLFAAPGAVYIQGSLSKKQNGIISAAGPVTNIVLALLFLALGYAGTGIIISLIGVMGFTINSWIALFNMIPFGPFDGAKILKWNKWVYGVIAAIAVVFVFLF